MPLLLEPGDNLEKGFNIGSSDTARGFIENEDSATDRERTRDFNQLALRYRQANHRRCRGDFRMMKLLKNVGCSRPHFAPADQPKSGTLHSQNNVFFHREIRSQRQLLMDHGYSTPPSFI